MRNIKQKYLTEFPFQQNRKALRASTQESIAKLNGAEIDLAAPLQEQPQISPFYEDERLRWVIHPFGITASSVKKGEHRPQSFDEFVDLQKEWTDHFFDWRRNNIAFNGRFARDAIQPGDTRSDREIYLAERKAFFSNENFGPNAEKFEKWFCKFYSQSLNSLFSCSLSDDQQKTYSFAPHSKFIDLVIDDGEPLVTHKAYDFVLTDFDEAKNHPLPEVGTGIAIANFTEHGFKLAGTATTTEALQDITLKGKLNNVSSSIASIKDNFPAQKTNTLDHKKYAFFKKIASKVIESIKLTHLALAEKCTITPPLDEKYYQLAHAIRYLGISQAIDVVREFQNDYLSVLYQSILKNIDFNHNNIEEHAKAIAGTVSLRLQVYDLTKPFTDEIARLNKESEDYISLRKRQRSKRIAAQDEFSIQKNRLFKTIDNTRKKDVSSLKMPEKIAHAHRVLLCEHAESFIKDASLTVYEKSTSVEDIERLSSIAAKINSSLNSSKNINDNLNGIAATAKKLTINNQSLKKRVGSGITTFLSVAAGITGFAFICTGILLIPGIALVLASLCGTSGSVKALLGKPKDPTSQNCSAFYKKAKELNRSSESLSQQYTQILQTP